MLPYPKCSLVTPTYNWPEALELLLLSIKAQTHLPDEVIIADDGSREDTKALIARFQANFPVPLIHIWHEDIANRKPAIMNKAIAAARYEYIVEIDGDIIMNRHFVEDHLAMAQPGQYLFGSRVNIQQDALPEIFSKKIIHFGFFSGGIKKRARTLRIPFLMKMAKPVNERSHKLRGCNMSFWRKDLIAVNGFNEGLTGWGIDDSEMIQRLHNIGILGKRLKFGGIAYHIWHREQPKGHIALNQQIEEETTRKKITYIPKGIDQYL